MDGFGGAVLAAENQRQAWAKQLEVPGSLAVLMAGDGLRLLTHPWLLCTFGQLRFDRGTCGILLVFTTPS